MLLEFARLQLIDKTCLNNSFKQFFLLVKDVPFEKQLSKLVEACLL